MALELSTFAAHLNTRFVLRRDDESPVDLELIEAVDRGSSPRYERFSILFRGPLAIPLEQRLYRMQHDALGEFELFVVPIYKEESGYVYEAVFNRIRPR